MSSDHNNSIEQSGASDDSIQQVHDQLKSTKPEKKVGYAAFPLVLLSIVCTLVFFGSLSLSHYSGHFDPAIYNENQKPTKGGAVVATVSPAQLGKRVYAANCVACHMANGQGVPGAFPPLAGSEWVNGSEQRITRIVLQGLVGKISVAGHEFNSAMPGLGASLKDDQIAHVLTYIRQEWGNNSPEVAAATVAKIRAETAGHAAWTADELLQIAQ